MATKELTPVPWPSNACRFDGVVCGYYKDITASRQACSHPEVKTSFAFCRNLIFVPPDQVERATLIAITHRIKS